MGRRDEHCAGHDVIYLVIHPLAVACGSIPHHSWNQGPLDPSLDAGMTRCRPLLRLSICDEVLRAPECRRCEISAADLLGCDRHDSALESLLSIRER